MVHVKVVVFSENPQRIDIPDTQVVTIQPRETQTIRFAPKASSNGVIEMQAHLSTPSGRSLGSQTSFVVKATQMDDVGWIIIVVSALVLIIATVLRIRQVTASSRRQAESNGEPQTSGPTAGSTSDNISDTTPSPSAVEDPDTASDDDSEHHLPTGEGNLAE